MSSDINEFLAGPSRMIRPGISRLAAPGQIARRIAASTPKVQVHHNYY